MKLFCLIAISDASACFNQFFAPMACKFGFPSLMAATVLGKPATPENQYLAIQYIQRLSSFIEIYFLYLSLIATICLCVDLVLMIKHPFKMKEPRMKIYMIVSTVSSLGVAILFITTEKFPNNF